MKHFFTLFFAFTFYASFGQSPCEGGRFSSDIFNQVTVTPNVIYGQNTSWSGGNTTLYFDFYEPQGDNLEARPLIIWVHGGSFLGGSRTESDMVALSNRFAKKGFACASISYRTGFFPIDSTNSVRAVVRAVQDLKGAIRFFYKDAATNNQYKIDTTNIFIGGSSAGAITALHVAYLNEACELYDYLTEAQQNALGGLEGNSGSAGYSTKVKGVLNGCGALARYSWLDPSNLEVPLASVHGTTDNVVTYNRGLVNPGVPLMYLDGSRMLHERACAIGLENQIYTFNGAGHVPYLGTSATAVSYMDTTVNFYRDFLVNQIGCTEPSIQPANALAQNAVLYNAAYCDGSSVSEVCATSNVLEDSHFQFLIAPNPASSLVSITTPLSDAMSMRILDISGRVVWAGALQSSTQVDISSIVAGTYIVEITMNKSGISQTQKLIIE